MQRITIPLLLTIAMFGACDDKDSQADIDERLIVEYIDDNGLDAQPTGSGLYYVIDEPGSDDHPTVSSRVSVRYTGKLLDGTVFDSSNGQIYSNELYKLIDGWQEGIPLFGRGGSGILLIPSHLGYGPNPVGSIPGNSVLIFDIELVDFM